MSLSAQVGAGDEPGQDAQLRLHLRSLSGGVPPPLGLEPVSFRERVHRLFFYTPFEGTSPLAPTDSLRIRRGRMPLHGSR